MIDLNERYSHNLTEQKIFDLTVHHLGTMPRRAVKLSLGSSDPDNGICQYKAPDGLKCAAGNFFSDEEYTPEMENKSLFQTDMQLLLPQRLMPFYTMLVRLQGIHDSQENWRNNRAQMRKELFVFGSAKGLNVDLIENPEMAWNKPDVRD